MSGKAGFGQLLIAVLALLALGIFHSASAYAAEEPAAFATDEGVSEIIPSSSEAGEFGMEFDQGYLTCKNWSLEGGAQQAGEALTFTPTFSNCTFSRYNTGTSVATNGCELRFNAGTLTNEGVPEEYNHLGTMDIVGCEEPMSFRDEPWGYFECTVSIPEQNDFGLVIYENKVVEGTRRVALTVESSSLSLEYSQEGPGCEKVGPRTNGVLGGSSLLSAQVSLGAGVGGKRVDLWVKPIAVGLHADGDSFEGQFLEVDTGIIHCTALSAYGSAPEETADATLGFVKYSGMPGEPDGETCEAFGLEAEVDFATNGCGYAFNAGTYDGEGTSTGSIDLVCNRNEGVIISVAGGLCTVWIPPQSIGGVEYKATGDEHSGIVMDASSSGQGELTGIEYIEGGICGDGEEIKADGYYEGGATVTATSLEEGEDPVDLSIVEGKGGTALFRAG